MYGKPLVRGPRSGLGAVSVPGLLSKRARFKMATFAAILVIPALALAASAVAASAGAGALPAGDTVTTVALPGGVVETLGSGPVKPTLGSVAPAFNNGAASALVTPLTTCDPSCGTGGIIPPVTLADTAAVKYSALNGNLEAIESSNLTGGQGFPTYNTQFGNSTATFYWLGSKPSVNWQSYAPGVTWTQTGIDIGVSVPAGVGFSGGSDDVVWSGGQGGSGEWIGSVSYAQKVGFSAVIATTAKFASTASVWLGGNAYGVTADASDGFGPVG
jgi:hypothetical protein